MDPAVLLELKTATMPFGKYQGRLLMDIPESYLLWMRQQGFPAGRLGGLLALALEIKMEGLEALLRRP
jgi:uncharacterized protein